MGNDRTGGWMLSSSRLAVVALALMLALALVVKRMPGVPLRVLPSGELRTHFLLDYEYFLDEASGEATMGHLVVLNPGNVDAELEITVYFEDREPASFTVTAPAQASTESNYTRWPVEADRRFALKVESTVPVFCQATIGWNNTSNDYDLGATTPSSNRPREAAKSYLSIPSLADRWYLPDGYIIDKPGLTWVSESEWLILLNPHAEDLTVTLTTYSHGNDVDRRLDIPAQRVRWIAMDERAPHNRHYGARVASPREIAAQWVRTVHWNDSSELMTSWSVPLAPLASNAVRDDSEDSQAERPGD